MAFENIERL